jgi:hypothetical protein
MGVWSSGPFDNDDAADFMMELETAPSWDVLRDVFKEAFRHEDYVELPEGARAYAAAALVTVAAGRSDISAQDYHMIIEDMGPLPDDLIALAKSALKRISTGDSEIRELYLDSGSYSEWAGLIAAIEKAL